jgi:hypothetical protein
VKINLHLPSVAATAALCVLSPPLIFYPRRMYRSVRNTLDWWGQHREDFRAAQDGLEAAGFDPVDYLPR